MARLFAVILLAAACGADATASQPPIRFLHTFNTQETELFNTAIAERGIAVESSLVPFARGQQVIAEILNARTAERPCPDLIRIDATWLPSLAGAGLLRPVPQGLVALDWTPEALALVADPTGVFAVPQSVDGLVVLRERDIAAPANPSVGALVTAARALRTDHAPAGVPIRTYPLGLRADGYWLVPWLRDGGGDLVPGGLDAPGASAAVATFAGLFGDLAPPPPVAGDESPDELRRWTAHEVAYWVTGPWQLGSIAPEARASIAASPLARAPRGGQLLAVPACASRPDDGWRLARELVDPGIAKRFADAFVTIPTRTSTLADAPPLVHAIADALVASEQLPRTAITPLLFDDLNPAIAAVAAHDATADEVLPGVRRGWARIVKRATPP